MVSPRFQSSGDLLADRRFEWARDCGSKGDLTGAIDLLEQTLEIVPGYASAWFLLGGLREKLDDRSGAIDAYRLAYESDPQDRHGAALMLMRLGAVPTSAMSQAYIRELFDQYAPAFERGLQNNLGYRAPAVLHEAVVSVCVRTGRSMHFGSILDLGCGTGLAGAAFRSCTAWLVGVDLSVGMLAEARRKNLYDRLAADDMTRFLAGEAEVAAQYHLVVAADVFVYAADLAPVVVAAERILAPDGLLAFTVETHDGKDAILGGKLRYAHDEGHVRMALASGKLDLLDLTRVSIRNESGVPVPGLMVIAASTLPRSQA